LCESRVDALGVNEQSRANRRLSVSDKHLTGHVDLEIDIRAHGLQKVGLIDNKVLERFLMALLEGRFEESHFLLDASVVEHVVWRREELMHVDNVARLRVVVDANLDDLQVLSWPDRFLVHAVTSTCRSPSSSGGASLNPMEITWRLQRRID
jgi:hypothetical protein